jgi:DNA end-binding protein Ku
MQAIWKGAISFGLVSIPIRLYSATEEKTLRFNQLHADDDGRIKYNRTCSSCGKDSLGKDDIVRGYEYEKGRYVKFTEDELDAVDLETAHRIEVSNFVPSSQIDPIYYQRSYYLAPDDLGAKAYALLRKALLDSDKVAIAKVALRDKERLATLRVRDGKVIVMETMYWPDEIREAFFPELDKDEEVGAKELKTAQSLIDNLTEDFDPAEFRDEYRDALLKLVEQKVAGQEIVVPVGRDEEPPVVDLMAALQQSLEAVKKRRDKAAG